MDYQRTVTDMPMTPDSRYGEWVEFRETRIAKGYSLSAFARASVISKGYLGDLEKGHKLPSPVMLAKIAVALNVPLGVIERRIDTWVAS